jgi:two-component system NtrC family response regulator
LKERGNDPLLLARAFLHRYSREFKKNIRGFKDEAVKTLSDYDWPGNVRELENRVKRGVVMSDSEWLSPFDLEFSSPDDGSKQILSLHEAREALEKRLISEALLRHGSNITHAAKELDISRQTLTTMINKYGITMR